MTQTIPLSSWNSSNMVASNLSWSSCQMSQPYRGEWRWFWILWRGWIIYILWNRQLYIGIWSAIMCLLARASQQRWVKVKAEVCWSCGISQVKSKGSVLNEVYLPLVVIMWGRSFAKGTDHKHLLHGGWFKEKWMLQSFSGPLARSVTNSECFKFLSSKNVNFRENHINSSFTRKW